jgi:Chaperone of endosialidase
MYSPHIRQRSLISVARYRAGLRFYLCASALLCLLVLPPARAVNPPPDGGYPNGNTAEGDNALAKLTSGLDNTALGNSTLHANTVGSDNTAVGFSALLSNDSGGENTAIGTFALKDNVGTNANTAVGFSALSLNTNGFSNTATGSNALGANTSGEDNTAVGAQALSINKSGSDNTATGFQALQNNVSSDNTADGFDALASSTTGSDNMASGFQALFSNTKGAENTASGFQALVNNTTGNDNTAVGSGALANTSIGASNVALGFDAGSSLTKGSNNIDIGANVIGVAGEANTIRLGKSGTQQKTFVAGIFGKTVASGSAVIINSSGQLGTVQSSARFKRAIKPMNEASEALLKLKPVTFCYKEGLDPEGIPQFGLIAEDVEKVDPDLVVRDEGGRVTSVRYEAVNAMLLNEFLKQHSEAQGLKATIARQQQQIETLNTAVQKLCDKVALNETGDRSLSGN